MTFVFVETMSAVSQEEKKFFFRDTLFEYNGNHYEISRSVATDEYFKCRVSVTNMTNNFLIFNPADIFGTLGANTDKINAVKKKVFVVPPKFSKSFVLKIEGKDCRSAQVNINMSKIQMSGNVLNTYNFDDLLFLKENIRENGPVKWVMKDRDMAKDGYRIVAEVSYKGDKFLALMYNNVVLKTADGGKFTNTGRRNEDFYYENGKPFEKCIFSFPIEEKRVNRKNAPTLSFPNVFKEYALLPGTGPKFTLHKGTEADYKGLNRAGSNIDENDTEDK